MKKSKKNNLELMHELRGSWTINPRTRVHDNNPKKNIKKQRQDAKNQIIISNDLV